MLSADSIDWGRYFPDGNVDISNLGKLDPKNLPENMTFIIPFDTEYQVKAHGKNENLCLSYQFSIYHVESGTYNEGIIYPDYKKKERFSLSYILEKAFESIGITGRSISGCEVILVSHFFSAELAMLKDRSKVVKKLQYIHKTAITSSRGGAKFHWFNSNNNRIDMKLNIKDTILTLPASHLSLDKASVFVDGTKEKLSQQVLSNMLHMLVTNKDEFDTYGLNDVRITLKLFVKLQYHLNVKLNGTKSTIYSTLSSASLKKYISYLGNALPKVDGKIDKALIRSQFPSKDVDKGCLYLEYEDLAKSAYLGGLNTAYNIGTFNDGIYLDMDFTSAYPTVMNMINMTDFGEKYD